MDASDGRSYSLASFVEVYGGSEADPPSEWHRSAPARSAKRRRDVDRAPLGPPNCGSPMPLPELSRQLARRTSEQELREGGPFLRLSAAGLGDEDAHVLSAHLRQSAGGFGQVVLANNQLGAGAAASLGRAMTANALSTRLRELDLFENALGDAGAIALADGVRHATRLEQLWLGRNGIGAEGGSAIADAIAARPSLRFVSLRDNRIGAAGCAALARALSVTGSGLNTLDLSANELDDAALGELAAMLRTSESLTELNCTRNVVFGAAAVGSLAESLSINTTLKMLLLDDEIVEAAKARFPHLCRRIV